MASHSFATSYGNVRYVRRGLGDPVVLVHNIYPGADHHEFDHNVAELARHFTVYAIDLLGFGESDAPRLKYTADTYVEILGAFLREVVAEPAAVVGAGLTCSYLTEIAAASPELFTHLVLICPRSEPVGLDSPRWFAPIRHFFFTTPPLGAGSYEAMAGEAELTQFLREVFYHPKHVTADLVERLHANANRPGAVYPYASLLTGYLDRHLLAALPRVKTPILLLWGRHARPTPVEHSVRLAALARYGRLEVIEDAGAWPHFEQSALVNRLIAEYLQSTPPDPAARPAAT
jgi:pimeloyl-ACP methyl ester carboxylesterase